MSISIPSALKSLSSAGTAARAINAWWKKARGDSRALLGELKDNLIYFDLAAEDGVELGELIDKVSVSEYQRLAKEGFNFNSLKRGKIENYSSLEGTDLAPWCGKETEALIESIYEKINDLKIRYPHVRHHERYRWKIRVNNIRKRIWLLLRHVRG